MNDRLEIYSLGGSQFVLNGVLFQGFSTRKVEALAIYVALNARRQPREVLADLFWDDRSQSRALSNLRVALTNLRKHLGAYFEITRDSVALNLEANVWLDVKELVAHLENNPGDFTDSFEENVESIQRALTLYQGEFLQGFSIRGARQFEEWVTVERERIHFLVIDGYRRTVGWHLTQGDYTTGIQQARRWLQLDSLNEAAHQSMMRLLTYDGQIGAAIRQYQECVRILDEELGVAPSTETDELYDAIQSQELTPPVQKRMALEVPIVKTEDEPPESGELPYKGLAYYDVTDSHLFFGREELTIRLGERLIKDRFLAVVGASGSGKSSLVRAGLIPLLQRNKRQSGRSSLPPGCGQWPIHLITPTAHPLQSLALSLTRETNSARAAAILMDDLANEPRSLAIYIEKLLAESPGDRLLLVVDQFEELFTQCRDEDERQAFVDNLLTAATGNSHRAIITVMTLRADFYAHCARYDGLRELLETCQIYIGQMNRAELRQAIKGPAEVAGWTFEAGLVELLLHDVGASRNREPEPGALPLLSHALLETWRRRRGRQMTFSSYAETGGVRRAIGRTAEDVFNNELTTEQRAIARSIFLRLTEFGEGAQDTRRRATLAEIISMEADVPSVEAVVKILADARLVITGDEGVEVAHEALIREWPRLGEWLAEDREGLRLHRNLTEAAQGWQVLGQDEGALYRGVRLAQATEWAEKNDKELNAMERDFLDASLALANKEKTEREAQQHRELEAARNLATVEKRRAEAQAAAAEQLRRRRRTLIGALVISSLLAVVAIFFGIQFRNSAKEAGQQSRVALAREIASRSEELLESDPELSLLIAIESVEGTLQSDDFATSEAELALYRALAVLDQRVLRGHTGEIFDASFSPDGQYVLTASADNMVRIWDIQGNPITTLEGHFNSVWAVNVSPDGERILTASGDGTARLWDFEGNEIAVLEHDDKPLYSASFSPDGQRIVTASRVGMAWLWDITHASGRLITKFESAKAIESVHFSPDGTRILVGLQNGAAELWDEQGSPIATLNTSDFSPEGARPSGPLSLTKASNFSPDGRRIVTGSADGTTYLWDVQGDLVTTLVGHEAWVWEASFSPNGELVVTASADGTARLWDVQGNPLTILEGHTDQVRSARFSPDGTQILTGSVDGTARLWDLAGNLIATLQGHSDIVSLVEFSPDGSHIVTGSLDGTARLWGVDGYLISRLGGHPAQVQSVSFGTDSKRILTTSVDGTARLWRLSANLDESADLTFLYDEFEGTVWSAIFTPDGSRVITTGDDGTVSLWNSEGNLVTAFEGHDGAVRMAAFSPSGDRLVTVGDDGTAKLWLSDGTFLMNLKGHIGPVRLAEFSRDGSRVVSVGWADTSPRLWDADGTFLMKFRGHDRPIVAVRFSSDGQKLIAAGRDPSPRLWDIEGNLLNKLDGHTGAINSVEFDSDGTHILTASDDGSAKLWDANGNLLVTLEGHTDAVLWAGFSPNGRRMVTTSQDGTVRLWNGDGSFILTLTGHNAAVHKASFSPDGTMLATASADGSVAVWRVFSTVDALLAAAKERVSRTLTEAECRQYLHPDHCPR